MLLMEQEAGLAQGEAFKEEAHVSMEDRHADLLRRARVVFVEALLRKGWATADDVRLGLTIPEGGHLKALGAVPRCFITLGAIEADGFEKSCRPAAHGRPLTRWELVDRSAAESWLRDNQ